MKTWTLKASTTKELALLYGLTPRALSKQLTRLESIIGKRIGYSYREEQILGIFENLGAPPFARVVLREHL